MGRLQALIAPLAALTSVLVCSGCDDKPKPQGTPGSKRNEAVLASASAPAPLPPAASSAPAAAKLRGPLCAGDPLNRVLPPDRVGHAEAAGTPALGETIPVGGGRWTWINLWAAWCVPCKEEMPRLTLWQKRLSANLSLMFMSLDDDERQLLKFLEDQPRTGVRASFWLPEGKVRDNWLEGLHLKSSPQLPVQILVNPQGRVHCIVDGAVDDADFPRVSAIVSHR